MKLDDRTAQKVSNAWRPEWLARLQRDSRSGYPNLRRRAMARGDLPYRHDILRGMVPAEGARFRDGERQW